MINNLKAKPLKNILFDYLRGSNFDKINETINIEIAWNNSVGKAISKNTEIISFKKGILTIKTSNPIWRNELSLQKQELINKLNDTQKEINIKELIFR